MADENPGLRAQRRRVRRRAEFAVYNLERARQLRNILLRRQQNIISETDSSGSVDSDGENEVYSNDGSPPDDSGDDSAGSANVDDLNAAVNDFVADEGNGRDLVCDVAVDEENGAGSDNDAVDEAGGNDHGGVDNIENVDDWTPEEKENYVIESLRKWGRSGGVLSMRKVDELLGMLSLVFKTMPKSYKTLLSTAKVADVMDFGDYKIWYKGIRANLDQMALHRYLETNRSVILDINIDGLPLFLGSPKKFWPILGKLVNAEDEPFIIALYFGVHDPRDVDIFLGDLVVELEELSRTGYDYNGMNFQTSVRNFILDAPARALVKCCVGHGGMGACEKCTVIGRYVERRVSYLHVGADCRLRSDASFSRREDPLHHCGRSPLDFLGIGMVSQFRLDSMHLVYKGVFLRFLEALFAWEGVWNVTAATFREISDKLCGFIGSCPRDFNRKPRKLHDYYKYKATELRRFLLYDAVVAFKGHLDDNVYHLFLLLHCAIYILASPYLLPVFLDKAKEYLNLFVQYSAEIFGEHFVVYNVHSITHLAEECRHNGTLECFSAFPYENHLKTIKQTLKSGYQALEQIVKRDSERREKREVSLPKQNNEVNLFKRHVGPVEEVLGEHYQRISINGVILKIGGRDSCFITTDGGIVVLLNIVQSRRNSIVLIGKKFLHSDNFYSYPMHSSCLGIFRVWELDDARETFNLEAVFGKCWLIPDGDKYVAVPLYVLVKFQPDSDDEDGPLFEPACRKWLILDPDSGEVKCMWPPGKLTSKQLQNLAYRQQDSDATWEAHPCEIVSTYRSYLDAHLGAKARESNPNYQTEKELGFGRRKSRKRKISSSSEESNDASRLQAVLPPPPKTSGSSVQSNQFKPVTRIKSPLKIVTKPSKKDSKVTTKPVRKDRGTKGDSVADIKALLKAKRDQVTSKKKLGVMATSPNWRVEEAGLVKLPDTLKIAEPLQTAALSNVEELESLLHTETSAIEQIGDPASVEKERVSIQSSLLSTHSATSPRLKKATRVLFPSSDKIPIPAPSFSKFQSEVLVGLQEIKGMLQIISANQTKLNLHLLPNEKVISCPDGMPNIPVTNISELESLESFLEKSSDNVSNLSVYLSAFVSKDNEYQSAMKVMSKVLNSHLGSNFSLKGLKGKRRFCDLKLYAAVQGAILWKIESDLSLTNKAIVNWLKDAPWRRKNSGAQKPRVKKSVRGRQESGDSPTEDSF